MSSIAEKFSDNAFDYLKLKDKVDSTGINAQWKRVCGNVSNEKATEVNDENKSWTNSIKDQLAANKGLMAGAGLAAAGGLALNQLRKNPKKAVENFVSKANQTFDEKGNLVSSKEKDDDELLIAHLAKIDRIRRLLRMSKADFVELLALISEGLDYDQYRKVEETRKYTNSVSESIERYSRKLDNYF